MRYYLYNMRKERLMTQRDVADELCITNQYYQLIEAGQRQSDLNASTIQKLATVFGKSVAEIHELEMAYQNERQECATIGRWLI